MPAVVALVKGKVDDRPKPYFKIRSFPKFFKAFIEKLQYIYIHNN